VNEVFKAMSLDDASFVTLLYHALLGRDPDPAGYDLHLARLSAGEVTHEQLASEFAVSDESCGWAVVEDRARRQLAERDTDHDWQTISASYPYFGVLADEKFLNPDGRGLEDFFASGEREIERLLRVIRERFGDFRPSSALDFGCGVGRLLIPMAKTVSRAVGVDVADRMLELARAHIAQSGVDAIVTKEIPTDETFDWINSFIVFQHIPPSRGYELIKLLWDRLRNGGCLSLHVTIYHDHTHIGELIRDVGIYNYDGRRAVLYASPPSVAEAGMSMYDYDLNRVFAILRLGHGQEVYLQHLKHGGCYGVLLYVQKQ
jgi:SAM-dependent methyltransferase